MRHDPARSIFISLFWSGALVSPFQAALAPGILADQGIACPIYLCSFFSPTSCSASGTPVYVSPILLPAAVLETQPKTRTGHLLTHNSALTWGETLDTAFF